LLNRINIFALILILFLSCSFSKEESSTETNIIFSSYGERYLNGTIVYQKNKESYAAYDDVSKKYWVHYFADNYSEFSEVCKDGIINEIIKVHISNGTPDNRNFFATDNVFLLFDLYSPSKYIIIDINLQKSFIFEIQAPEEFYRITGFSGEIIFTDRWYYNIYTNIVEYFPMEISQCLYQPAVDKVIGLSEQNKLIFFELAEKKIIDLDISDNISWLYYYSCNENSIYYTKNKRRNITQAFYHFLGVGGQPVYWYKYDFDSKKETKIFCPGDFPRIIGSVK